MRWLTNFYDFRFKSTATAGIGIDSTCNVTPLAPTHFTSLFKSFPFMGGDQLVVPRWVTHISCPYKNTIEGAGENRTNEQTRTMLGVNSEQKESMQHYISDSIYGLTLAWITSENSTKQLECRHLLTRSFSLGPIFSATVSPLRCPVSTAPVRGSTPTACQLLSPTNSLSCPLTTSGFSEISGPKTLCPVSRQNRQRNRLLGGPPI